MFDFSKHIDPNIDKIANASDADETLLGTLGFVHIYTPPGSSSDESRFSCCMAPDGSLVMLVRDVQYLPENDVEKLSTDFYTISVWHALPEQWTIGYKHTIPDPSEWYYVKDIEAVVLDVKARGIGNTTAPAT